MSSHLFSCFKGLAAELNHAGKWFPLYTCGRHRPALSFLWCHLIVYLLIARLSNFDSLFILDSKQLRRKGSFIILLHLPAKLFFLWCWKGSTSWWVYLFSWKQSPCFCWKWGHKGWTVMKLETKKIDLIYISRICLSPATYGFCTFLYA